MKTLSEVYAIAKNAYDKPSATDVCEVSCYNAIQVIISQFSAWKEKVRKRQERVDKLVALNAPAIILQNEYRMLGNYAGILYAYGHIIKLAGACKAVQQLGDEAEPFMADALRLVGNETCFNCKYNLFNPEENESNACLANAVCCLRSNGTFGCSHFKCVDEPYWSIRDKQEGATVEERADKADVVINAEHKKFWEETGKPNFLEEDKKEFTDLEDEAENATQPKVDLYEVPSDKKENNK